MLEALTTAAGRARRAAGDVPAVVRRRPRLGLLQWSAGAATAMLAAVRGMILPIQKLTATNLDVYKRCN